MVTLIHFTISVPQSDSYSSSDEDEEDSISSSDAESVCSNASSVGGELPTSVFVGSALPEHTTEDHIRSHFSQFSASITGVRMPRDHETKKFKGFAFVYFASAEVAQEAIRKMNRSRLLGRTLRVAPQRKAAERNPSDPSQGKQKQKRPREKKPKEKRSTEKPADSVKVTVSHFPASVTFVDLSSHFSAYNPLSVSYRKGKSGKTNCRAVIAFTSMQTATKVVQEMNGSLLLGCHKITVRLQKRRASRTHVRKKSSSSQRADESPSSPPQHPQSWALVSNIPSEMNKEEIKSLFSRCGDICSCLYTSGNHEMLIAFSSSDSAQKAVSEFHGQRLLSQAIQVTIPVSPSGFPSYPQPPSPSDGQLPPHHIRQAATGPPNPPFIPPTRPRPLLPVPIPAPSLSYPLAAPPSPHNLPTPPFGAVRTLPPPSGHTPRPPPLPTHYRNIAISEDLYQFFQQHARKKINEFVARGGSVDYQKEVRLLVIRAKDVGKVVQFNQCVDCYSERQLLCTPDHWNWLVMVGPTGSRKVDELRMPFNSNPNVQILEKTSPKVHILFVGTKDATTAAYDHFTAALNQELVVDRLVKVHVTLV